MTDPVKPSTPAQTPLSTGSMSSEGTTNIVQIQGPNLSPSDKKVLCSAICKCKSMPGIGKDGRSLKQACVSGRLEALDKALEHRSEYKPELTYDMTKKPPAPIMDKEIETKKYDLFPNWTKNLWPKDPERPVPYKAGQGYTRRPDVVIVNDPTKPPTQDNIKHVVEIKFPGDTFGRDQETDYIRIAGDRTKYTSMGPEDCDCDRPEPEKSKIPVEQLGKAAAAAGLIYSIMTRRPPPAPAW